MLKVENFVLQNFPSQNFWTRKAAASRHLFTLQQECICIPAYKIAITDIPLERCMKSRNDHCSFMKKQRDVTTWHRTVLFISFLYWEEEKNKATTATNQLWDRKEIRDINMWQRQLSTLLPSARSSFFPSFLIFLRCSLPPPTEKTQSLTERQDILSAIHPERINWPPISHRRRIFIAHFRREKQMLPTRRSGRYSDLFPFPKILFSAPIQNQRNIFSIYSFPRFQFSLIWLKSVLIFFPNFSGPCTHAHFK